MESEVQHIINISLNKIVASRHRKGGINLHRNLLVASVLFKAKDAYIAETVAKRKRDMDAEAVVPSFEPPTPVGEELSDALEDMKTDISSIPQSDLIRLEMEEDEQTKSEQMEKDCCSLEGEFQNMEMETNSSDTTETSSLGVMVIQCELTSQSSSEKGKPILQCSRKRRSSEIEACPSDITEYSNSVSDSITTDRSKWDSENYTPCKKQSRLDTCSISSYSDTELDFVLPNSSGESGNNSFSHTGQEEAEWNSSSDEDSDDSEDDERSSRNDVSDCYRSVYPVGNPTFSSQVGLSHSGMLIATM